MKAGGTRKVRWSRSEVTGPDGRPIVYAVGIDVTDEQEMLRRTLRAERLAAVGTMAAGLAHEVRNPLNSASLQLTVLERRLARGEGAATTVLPIAEHHQERDRPARSPGARLPGVLTAASARAARVDVDELLRRGSPASSRPEAEAAAS